MKNKYCLVIVVTACTSLDASVVTTRLMNNNADSNTLTSNSATNPNTANWISFIDDSAVTNVRSGVSYTVNNSPGNGTDDGFVVNMSFTNMDFDGLTAYNDSLTFDVVVDSTVTGVDIASASTLAFRTAGGDYNMYIENVNFTSDAPDFMLNSIQFNLIDFFKSGNGSYLITGDLVSDGSSSSYTASSSNRHATDNRLASITYEPLLIGQSVSDALVISGNGNDGLTRWGIDVVADFTTSVPEPSSALLLALGGGALLSRRQR